MGREREREKEREIAGMWWRKKKPARPEFRHEIRRRNREKLWVSGGERGNLLGLSFDMEVE